MDSPLLVAQEAKGSPAALVVDKKNIVGKNLVEKLQQYVTTIFVSQSAPLADSSIIHIPFGHSIPTIPDGQYSHIFFVWEAEDKELLHPLLQKAQETKGKLILIVQQSKEKEVKEYLGHVLREMVLIVIGDIFSSPLQDAPLDTWLIATKKTKKVILSNMGLSIVHPIDYKDVIEGIFAIAFSKTSPGDIFFLFPKHPYTQLALSHTLQKVDPSVSVDFSTKEEKENEQASVLEGKWVYPEYPTLEKLQKFYQRLVVREDNYENTEKIILQPLQLKKPQRKIKKGSGIAPFILYTLFIFICFPVIAMLFFALLGKTFLTSGIHSLQKGDPTTAAKSFQAAGQNFSYSLAAATIVQYEVNLFGQGSQIQSLSQQISLGQKANDGLYHATSSLQKIHDVLLGKSIRPQEDVVDGINEAKNAFVIFQAIPLSQIPTGYRDTYVQYMKGLQLVENIADIIPQILVGKGEKKYLILFQNNMELRPGGGFIGSYGLITFTNGRFKDFTIHDVYDADGQLKGHVEPPFPIRRYVPIPHLYLRDSNFDVDNTINGSKAAFLFQAETGNIVDGVVSLDLSLVKNVLGAIGQVYVPAYSETVTKDNFFLLAEQHAEKNFFAGSSQKKDFLSAFFTALQEKISDPKNIAPDKLLGVVLQSITEKHLLFSFPNPTIQSAFSVNNLSSALWDGRDITSGFLDFLGINEANLGGNKVNYYVTRNITQKITVADSGQVNESVALKYTNSSIGEWPGGDYKNYLRLILPKNTTIQSISINGQDQKIIPAITDPTIYEGKYFVSPKALELDKTEENGKDIVGFFVTVPTKSSVNIVVNYILSQKVQVGPVVSKYSFQLFKQPGIDDMPYSLTISYPKGYSLFSSTDTVSSGATSAIWTSDITKDTTLDLTFEKK